MKHGSNFIYKKGFDSCQVVMTNEITSEIENI
jgi:hypothetical protein